MIESCNINCMRKVGWGGGGGGGGGRGSYPKGGQLTHPRILGVRRGGGGGGGGGGQGGSLSEWRSCPVTAAVAVSVCYLWVGL